jgi:hypothetical protein
MPYISKKYLRVILHEAVKNKKPLIQNYKQTFDNSSKLIYTSFH